MVFWWIGRGEGEGDDKYRMEIGLNGRGESIRVSSLRSLLGVL